MATIGKIRKRSGLLIGIIGVALGLFVMNDLFTKNKTHSQDPVAVVFDENITYREFTAKVEEQKEFYKMQYGDYQFSGAELFQLNNSVYDQMVQDIILQKQYDDLGLAVSDAELNELFMGTYVHSYIRQLFTSPETGIFDPTQVQMYIETLDERSDEERRQWRMIEKAIYDERFNTKYNSLVTKGYYIPTAFAERDNIEKNKKYVTQYLGLKYNNISDSTITVSDEEMMAYYEEHKQEYIFDNPFVNLEFVVFDIKPSGKDLAEIQEIIDTAYAQFPEVENADIESFIYSKSDIDFTWDSSYLRRDVLPVKADTLFNAPIGTIIAPYMENYVFYMHKLLDRKNMPDSLNAAHILIAYQGAMRADGSVLRTKEEAEALADSLLGVVRGLDSLSFSQVALQFSNDASAEQNGGYLGWFPEGMMVPEFNEACLNNPVGSYQVIETAFGYHVIKVLDKTAPVQKIKMATIQRTVEPSKETADSIYALASTFASECTDATIFDQLIIDKAYTKRLAENVKTTDYTLPGIEEGREIIRWAFNEETEVGAISTVFDLIGEDRNVVVHMKDRTDKGQAEFEDVKVYIEPFVKKDKKAEMLMTQMNEALNGVTGLDALAKKLNVEIDTFDVAFATYSLPGYGPEPQCVGIISVLPINTISRPIKGETAIFVAQVSQVVEAPPADINLIRMQKQSFFQSKVSYELFKALQNKAEIEDNRILYF